MRGVDERGKEFLEFATALNVSAGGALLACRRDLSPGARISLEIPPAPSPGPGVLSHSIRTARARVVRVKHFGNLNLCGLKFTRPLAKS